MSITASTPRPPVSSRTRSATGSARWSMTCAAPAERAKSLRAGVPAVAMTCAPRFTAIWVTYCPTMLPPPMTRSERPSISPASRNDCSAVSTGMPTQAPSSKVACSGRSTAYWDGRQITSAAVPEARLHCPFQSQTRWPSRLAGTPSPTASITPAPSLCGMTHGVVSGRRIRLLTSDGLTAETWTRTLTSPATGIGSVRSLTTKTSFASPFCSYQAARMSVSQFKSPVRRVAWPDSPRNPRRPVPQSRPARSIAEAIASGSVNHTSWLPLHSMYRNNPKRSDSRGCQPRLCGSALSMRQFT